MHDLITLTPIRQRYASKKRWNKTIHKLTTIEHWHPNLFHKDRIKCQFLYTCVWCHWIEGFKCLRTFQLHDENDGITWTKHGVWEKKVSFIINSKGYSKSVVASVISMNLLCYDTIWNWRERKNRNDKRRPFLERERMHTLFGGKQTSKNVIHLCNV